MEEYTVRISMRTIIYVQPGEHIASLIDRIEHVQEDIAYVAAESNPGMFTDPLQIKLLKREAVALHKSVVIVSQDQTVLDSAHASGFDVLNMTSSELEEQNRQSEVQAVAPAPETHQEVNVRVVRNESLPAFLRRDPETEVRRVPVASRAMLRDEEVAPHGAISFSWKFILLSFLGAGLVASIGFWALSPQLSVSIVSKKETIRFDFQVTADSNLSKVDVEKTRVPGQNVKVEKEVSGEFTATGKQEAESKAEGELTIYNEFSASPQQLIKNTRFETKDGKMFRLKTGVTVPGATMAGNTVSAPGIVTADAIADQPGDSYNVGPSDFTIPGFAGTPKFAGFYAKSAKQMTGGGAQGTFSATSADLENANKTLQEKLTTEISEYINANIPQGLVVLEGAKAQGTPEFTADTPDSSGKFNARLKVTYEVFGFSENDVATIAEDMLTRRLQESQKTVAGTRVITYEAEALNAAKSALNFTVKVNELAAGSVDEGALRESLAGKSEDEIRQILRENDAIESAEVTFWPRWISLAPSNPDRVKVTVEGL